MRVGGGLLLGTVGVLLALLEPSTGEYISALAAAWVVFGRIIFHPYEVAQRRCGAMAHELFDTEVFCLPWNFTTVGRKPAGEDVRNWGRGQEDDGVRDWYADARPARHPVDVLVSQRSVITWARQDHAIYAQVLRWFAGSVFVGTLILGSALHLSVGDYLLRIGVPMLPALLDILDTAAANSSVANSKARLEQTADEMLAVAHDGGRTPTLSECRQLQDGIYATRLRPGVPTWMYRRTRNGRQQNMDVAVAAQVQALPPALR
jgi:hypothetical protein